MEYILFLLLNGFEIFTCWLVCIRLEGVTVETISAATFLKVDLVFLPVLMAFWVYLIYQSAQNPQVAGQKILAFAKSGRPFKIYTAASLFFAALAGGVAWTPVFNLSEKPRSFLLFVALLAVQLLLFLVIKRFEAVERSIRTFFESAKGISILLIGLYVVSVLVSTLAVTSTAYGPVHFNDEPILWKMAQTIAGGEFSASEQHKAGPGYPIAILPVFYLFSPLQWYAAVKLLNSLYIGSVIFPVYFILRRFTNRPLSFLGAVLLLLNPVHLVMPRSVLTENTYYPLFMWAVMLSFTHLFDGKHKKILRLCEAVLLGLVLGLLALTRFISMALIPVFLICWWLKPFDDEKSPFVFPVWKVLCLGVIGGLTVALIAPWVLLGRFQGVPAAEMLGFSIGSNFNPEQVTFDRLVMWAVFYLSYAILMAAPVLSPLILGLVKLNLKKWNEDALQRWIVVVLLITGMILVACTRHSWRVPYNYPEPAKIQGRYLLYLGPLFFITAIAVLKHSADALKMTFKKFVLLETVSLGLPLLAYAILYRGLFYLGHPLLISVSSPDGYLIDYMGWTFVAAITILITVTNLVLLIENKTILLAVVLLGVGSLYWAGNDSIYHRGLMVNTKQWQNFHAAVLVDQLLDDFEGEELANARFKITLFTTKKVDSTYYQTTFRFRGLRAPGKVEKKPPSDGGPFLVFQKDEVDIYSIYLEAPHSTCRPYISELESVYLCKFEGAK